MMAAGRPTKYNPDYEPMIKLMAEKGATDAEMAKAVGVTFQTFNNWKKAKPKFFESLKDWKITADLAVEQALYKRACGMVVRDGDKDRELPPDATSMIFWLKNRQPAKWREKQDNGEGEESQPLQITINTVDASVSSKP